jgi:hypothetical protein
MYRMPALIAASIAAVTLSAAGCGSSASTTAAKPHLSAATACGGYQKWAAQFPEGPDLGAEASNPAKMGPLLAAIAAAPSGQLYSDLKTLGGNISQAAAASQGVKSGMQMLVVSAAHVRGREKVSAGGQVEVSAGGQLKVSVPRSSCRRGV